MTESSDNHGIVLNDNGDPLNGIRDGRLYAFGHEVRIFNRKPRVTKAGSASRKDHLPPKQADNRQSVGAVGSTMNTEHGGDMESRPVERTVIRKEK